MLNYTTYNLSSNSDWVTFIHGAGGSSSIWYKQLRDFKAEYNILILDLRDHGKSKMSIEETPNTPYTFDLITNDIIEVLDYLNIDTSHFVGISLGTILIRHLAENHARRIQSMILAGAIVKFNFKSKFLIASGNFFKPVIPYMVLYKIFAFAIMPHKNHKQSRMLFVREAKKLGQKEFIRWFKMTSKVNVLLQRSRENDIKIPTLYMMGEEDHLFLPSAKKLAEEHLLSQIFVVPNSGHVSNIDQPLVFNTESIQFLKSLK